jgi:hypothetical protein
VTNSTAGTPGKRPPGRYGERRPNRALVVVLILVCAALLGWLVWAAWAASTPDSRSTLLGFRVRSDRAVEVRFEVTARREKTVVCRVQAQDSSGNVVGVTQVEVPPGQADRREAETVLSTRARAVTATVERCRTGPDD